MYEWVDVYVVSTGVVRTYIYTIRAYIHLYIYTYIHTSIGGLRNGRSKCGTGRTSIVALSTTTAAIICIYQQQPS